MSEDIVVQSDSHKNQFSEEMLCLMSNMGITVGKLVKCIVEKEIQQSLEKVKHLENLLASGVSVCDLSVSSEISQKESQTTINS